MSVAALYDVHGNLPALDAVLAEPDVAGADRIVVGATPRDDVELFTVRTPEERLAPVFAGVEADVVVCGHTHMQFDRRVGSVRVVNAGSVGMPYEEEPGAYWALLGETLELRRTPYDVEGTVAAIAASGFGEWPSATKAEAEEYFESHALGG